MKTLLAIAAGLLWGAFAADVTLPEPAAAPPLYSIPAAAYIEPVDSTTRRQQHFLLGADSAMTVAEREISRIEARVKQ